MHVSVAIIGAGPRGLSVLERICSSLGNPWDTMTVHLVDPNPPGAGTHRLDQPNYLLMNTISGQVSMFRAGDSAAAGAPISGPSLAEWAGVNDHEYLSRSVLGHYLSYCYRRFLSEAPETITIQEHQSTAEGIQRHADESWTLQLANGATLDADFVFLTTGHSTNQPTADDDALEQFAIDNFRANRRLNYFRSCYPLEQFDVIAPETRVAVRGMGLSAIDAVASLTIGRGGRFVAKAGGGLTYRPSGGEPQIFVYSRSNRIFWARAVNQKAHAESYQANFLTGAQIQALRQRDGQLDFEEQVLPLLVADMQVAAGAIGATPNANDVEAILQLPADANHPTLTQTSLSEHQSVMSQFLTMDADRAAEGNQTNPIKTATDAVRDLRNELRIAVEHRVLTPASHQRFNQLYAPMFNAIAAGPPASRSLQWRALFDSGVLQLAAGPGAKVRLDSDSAQFVIESEQQSESATSCDVVIGASLDTFMPERDTSALTQSLLKSGLARPFQNGWFRPGGFDIDKVGRLIGIDGDYTANICALGHLTEGPNYFTNMLPSPGVDSRVTADAAAAVAAMTEYLGKVGTRLVSLGGALS